MLSLTQGFAATVIDHFVRFRAAARQARRPAKHSFPVSGARNVPAVSICNEGG
jgi:hypothetical protein